MYEHKSVNAKRLKSKNEINVKTIKTQKQIMHRLYANSYTQTQKKRYGERDVGTTPL